MNTCPRCIGGTYEKQEDGLVCRQCGYRPDDKPFPDVVKEIARTEGKKPPTAHSQTRPYTKRSSDLKPRKQRQDRPRKYDYTEEERVLIVRDCEKRSAGTVSKEIGVHPTTLYNWRDCLGRHGVTLASELRHQKTRQVLAKIPNVPELHPMIGNLLQELPLLGSKPSEALLDGFACAFKGILRIIYLKE